MSFFTDIESAIVAEAKVLEADVVKALPFIEAVGKATAQELGTAALQAVLAQAPLVISGSEKLSAAVSSVGQTLAADGKAAALSDTEIAVQAAYNQLGLSKTAAAPAN